MWTGWEHDNGRIYCSRRFRMNHLVRWHINHTSRQQDNTSDHQLKPGYAKTSQLGQPAIFDKVYPLRMSYLTKTRLTLLSKMDKFMPQSNPKDDKKPRKKDHKDPKEEDHLWQYRNPKAWAPVKEEEETIPVHKPHIIMPPPTGLWYPGTTVWASGQWCVHWRCLLGTSGVANPSRKRNHCLRLDQMEHC